MALFVTVSRVRQCISMAHERMHFPTAKLPKKLWGFSAYPPLGMLRQISIVIYCAAASAMVIHGHFVTEVTKLREMHHLIYQLYYMV